MRVCISSVTNNLDDLVYTRCPDCSHDKLKLRVETPTYHTVSVKTGKILKTVVENDVMGGHFSCKCGWAYEAFNVNELFKEEG